MTKSTTNLAKAIDDETNLLIEAEQETTGIGLSTSTHWITSEQLLDLDLSHSIEVEIVEYEFEALSERDNYEHHHTTTYSSGGCAVVRLTSKCGVTVVINACFAASGTYRQAHKHQISIDKNASEGPLLLEEAVLIDDNGHSLDDFEAKAVLHEAADQYHWQRAVTDALPKAQFETLEETVEDEEVISIENDDGPSLRFNGRLIAEAVSDLSGLYYRSERLRVYKTHGERYVCSQARLSEWNNVPDKFRVVVADDLRGVVEFFGSREPAQEIYDSLGALPHTLEVPQLLDAEGRLSTDVECWCRGQIKGAWLMIRTSIAFELASDAMLFKTWWL